MTVRLTLLTTLILLAGTALAGSPAEAAVAAHADALRLPPATQIYTRYLSLYAVPAARRDEFVKVISYQVNALSRSADPYPPRQVTPDLLAVNWKDYGWDPAVWERLAAVDPYFHQKVKLGSDAVVRTVWPGGKQDGAFFKAGYYKETRKAGSIIDASAPWLPTKEITALREMTYSEAPVLRADWFLVQTAIQADRVAGYYDWLGLGKKEADFEVLIGADKKASQRVKREVAAVLARSGVTLKNRGIVRFQGVTGGYWVTQDFKTSVGRQNVLRLLDGDLDPPQGDASERYGVLPNGLFAFWLQDAKGVRQDKAPAFIASDKQSAGNDPEVHAGKSCIVCHVEGLRPIDDYARRIYHGSIKLASPDYDKYLRLRQLYLSDLDRWLARDRADYAEALWKAAGLKPADLARSYGRAWDSYVETDLVLADAARELGVEEKALLATLKRYAADNTARGILTDPVLAGLIQDPAVPVIRDHWEEVFGLVQTIMKGAKP